MVGRTPTNDRRFRAGFTENNLCRFCKSVTETLLHLVTECPDLPCRDSQPEFLDGLGPNFQLLGLVEVPPNIVLERLSATSVSQISVAQWSPTSVDQTTFVWTDGSCDFPEFFWMCKGGFSIVNQDGECIHNGTVQYPVLSSYSTELWALIYAFCMHPNPVWVSSDCDSILSQTNQLISSLKSPTQLATFWMVVLLAFHLWTTPESLRQSLMGTLTFAWNHSNLPDFWCWGSCSRILLDWY